MKRSLQEIIELLVFGLIALLVGIGLLWVVGWLLGLVGIVFKAVAGFFWLLLRFIIPIAIVAAAIYALIKLAQRQEKKVEVTPSYTPTPPPPPPASTSNAESAAAPAADSPEDATATEETEDNSKSEESKQD